MFDARVIRIFVGVNFHNIDASRLKSLKVLLTLLLLRLYSINIVCHNHCFLFMK